MENDILGRLRADPGRRTLGELLQEGEAAANAIENLRSQLTQKRIVHPPAGRTTNCTGNQERVLLRLRDVCQMVGLSRSTIYKRLAEERFPEPIRLGERTVRWSAEAITVWWRTPSATHEAKYRYGRHPP